MRTHDPRIDRHYLSEFILIAFFVWKWLAGSPRLAVDALKNEMRGGENGSGIGGKQRAGAAYYLAIPRRMSSGNFLGPREKH